MLYEVITTIRLAEIIPLPIRAILFEIVMLLVWAIDVKHRKIGRINLRIAFPEMEDRKAARIIRLCYQRMGTAAARITSYNVCYTKLLRGEEETLRCGDSALLFSSTSGCERGKPDVGWFGEDPPCPVSRPMAYRTGGAGRDPQPWLWEEDRGRPVGVPGTGGNDGRHPRGCRGGAGGG